MQPSPIKQIYLKPEEKKSKIAFLDRDGTLNEEMDLLTEKSQINIFENSFKSVKLLNELGYIVLVITNQPVVARGLISVEELKEINDTFFTKFKEKGAIINGIYSCIHHPNANIEEFRVVCRCRKPGTLMLEEGFSDFDATANGSFVAGDKNHDIKAGKDLGIFSVLIRTGYAGHDETSQVGADLILDNIYEVAIHAKSNFKNEN